MFLSFRSPFPARQLPAVESLQLGSRTVPLLVVRNPRARRYLLRVRPDGAARLTIPRGGSRSEAQSFLERNRGWLEQQLDRQQAQPRGRAVWHVGSEVLFRGELVRVEMNDAGGIRVGAQNLNIPAAVMEAALQIRPSTTAELRREVARAVDGPRFQSDTSGVETKPAGGSQETPDLRPIIERHCRALASVELVARVAELAAKYQFSVQRVTVRNQKSRWGSCSRRGTISLNWRLIQTPISVRDYIILHELAHLRHMDHSSRFWQEVERLCPEYLVAEKWLKANRRLLR